MERKVSAVGEIRGGRWNREWLEFVLDCPLVHLPMEVLFPGQTCLILMDVFLLSGDPWWP